MLFDLSATVPFAIVFGLATALGICLTVVALAARLSDRRRPVHPVVGVSAVHRPTAAATRRAA
ncbi:hypothetical protein BH09ACT12_BH09ACT12_12790 [soil metagenome]